MDAFRQQPPLVVLVEHARSARSSRPRYAQVDAFRQQPPLRETIASLLTAQLAQYAPAESGSEPDVRGLDAWQC